MILKHIIYTILFTIFIFIESVFTISTIGIYLIITPTNKLFLGRLNNWLLQEKLKNIYKKNK